MILPGRRSIKLSLYLRCRLAVCLSLVGKSLVIAVGMTGCGRASSGLMPSGFHSRGGDNFVPLMRIVNYRADWSLTAPSHYPKLASLKLLFEAVVHNVVR